MSFEHTLALLYAIAAAFAGIVYARHRRKARASKPVLSAASLARLPEIPFGSRKDI